MNALLEIGRLDWQMIICLYYSLLYKKYKIVTNWGVFFFCVFKFWSTPTTGTSAVRVLCKSNIYHLHSLNTTWQPFLWWKPITTTCSTGESWVVTALSIFCRLSIISFYKIEKWTLAITSLPAHNLAENAFVRAELIGRC
jgi:hypothetical protein